MFKKYIYPVRNNIPPLCGAGYRFGQFPRGFKYPAGISNGIYIFLFVVLGIITSFLTHALLEIVIIYLLIWDFAAYGLGLNWQTWFTIHHIGTVILFLLGVWLGWQQGNYWWKYIYIDKKYSGRGKIFLLLFSVAAPLLFSPISLLAQTRTELEEELKKIETQILQYEKELATTKTEKQTLTNKINQLKKEQSKLTLQIKSTNVQIKELGQQLSVTENSIEKTAQKLNGLQEEMGSILRNLQERGEKSPLEILGQTGTVTAFLNQIETLEQLSQNLDPLVKQTKEVKKELEGQYADLENKQADKKNLLSIQILQNQNLRAKADEQNKILKETRGKEVKYQASLADSKKRAQEIRSRIYELLGVSAQITFGEAVEVAQWAEKTTGVRAALLLAVLTQESNLGKNVGQCTLVDATSGRSRSINTGAVFNNGIHPRRDLPPLLDIARELGRDPLETAVSCPLAGVPGYGGAMGPAQFIPSTWVLYQNKITAITGKNASNPWDIKDAFIAAALLLKDNGAAGAGSNAEWKAAMLYFSGSTNLKFRFYGDSVIALTKKYDEDIRALG